MKIYHTLTILNYCANVIHSFNIHLKKVNGEIKKLLSIKTTPNLNQIDSKLFFQPVSIRNDYTVTIYIGDFE